MKSILLVSIVLSLIACASLIGDNVVYVRGQVSEECILRLKHSDVKNMHYQTRKIKGAFGADFTISPKPANYDLTIRCQGNMVLQKTVYLPKEHEKLNVGLVYSAKT